MQLPQMNALANFCHEKLQALEAKQQRRRLLHAPEPGMIDMASNDYLGLVNHPQIVAAGIAAYQHYGAGAGASRLVTGNHALYAPLEAAIARKKNREAALVFGSGYLTNLGVIPALVGQGDLILADKLVHACLLDGAQLSGATVKRFKHNDGAHAKALLEEHRSKYHKALLLVDHVYSMDGDVAPLEALTTLAAQYDTWVLADDAHGFGIVDSDAPVDIWMGTLSKAVGGYGGYVAADRSVIEYLLSSARSFMFSTGLPPSVCASALEAIQIMTHEPERAQRALAHARSIKPDAQSTIVPILLGDEQRALHAAQRLQAQGILAVAIRPPTVPPGTARLRLSFSAKHTEENIAHVRDTLVREGLL